MSQMTRLATTGGVVLTLCGALFGCSARTYVSGTGSTPAQFTHVFITTQEVWFNTNANASPDDSGWSKFPLTNPVTIDLVQESNGTLGQIAGDLRVAPGTYNSILLLPVATTLATTTSATALGATYNEEADFVDPSGTSHQVQLVIPNPEKGIVASGTSLKVPVGGGGLPTSSSSTSTTGTTSTTSTTGTTTSGTSTSSSNTTVTVSFGTNFDANRDLHLFNYTISGTALPGVLLGPNPVATDLATTGGISGTITLTSTSLTSTTTPTALTSVSDRVAIQASAELLSADGSHHYIVASAPVQTDGTFTIYPLQSDSKTPTVYDVVIHGPGIQTIIVKNVSVTTTTPSLADAAATTGAVATTTASGAVNIGTINPVASTSFYYVNVTPNTTTPLPAGAAVTFYETLPASGEKPYAIDEVGIDPINQNLQTAEPLAVGPIESGVYATSGSTITVTSAVPGEGSGKYLVGATAPLFADAGLSSSDVAAPGTTTYTTFQATPTAVNVTVPSLSPANSAAAGSISAAITTSSSQYDSGELLVSHNGAVIGSVSISGALAASGGGTVTINNLPSNVGNYYLSAILWSSTGSATFAYQSIASPVTVTAGSATDVSVTVQ